MSIAARAALALAFASSTGCRRAPPPTEAGANDPHPPPSASIAPSAESAPEHPFVAEGCASTISLEGTAEQVLERLQAACAPNTVALNAEPAKVSPTADKPAEARLRLDDPAACLHVAAFSADRGANLSLIVKDASGHVVAEDSLTGPVALVEKDGPICLRQAGELTLVVGVAQGNATALVRAWRAR